VTDLRSEESVSAEGHSDVTPGDGTSADIGPAERVSESSDRKKPSPSFLRWTLETLVMIALAFLLAQGVKAYVLQPFVIPTGSMESTILSGDRVLAEKITFRFRDPRPGDIVVFDDPTGRHPQLIKRVIAVGGQTVDIAAGRVFIDGEPLDEPYLDEDIQTDPVSGLLPLELADGEIWLMGDNRPSSGDSRLLGPVDVSLVQGRAFATYWPFDRIGPLR